MKKGIISIFCVLFGVLALAGETALLLYTQRSYVSGKRQEYASELKDSVVKLSASLRMGEAENFDEALAGFDNSLEKLSPYLEEGERQRLSSYREALGADETQELLRFNAALLQLKASQKDSKDLETDDDDIKKTNEGFKKLKDCEVYCSAKDYREIESMLKDGSEKLTQKIEAKEQENAERLGSEELIEWLSVLK